MVVFPVYAVKIGYLFLRTLSKPVAKTLKSYIATHPSYTKYIVGLGQFSHRFWAQVEIRSAGHKGLRIKPLEEAAALGQGAEAFAELFVFTVAGLTIVAEITRNDYIKRQDDENARLKVESDEKQLADMLIAIENKLMKIETSQRRLKDIYGLGPLPIK
jgi:optic atrophy 3 protein